MNKNSGNMKRKTNYTKSKIVSEIANIVFKGGWREQLNLLFWLIAFVITLGFIPFRVINLLNNLI